MNRPVYDLEFIQKPTHLHFIVRGQNTIENVKGYLAQVLKECIARGCDRVLIEENLQGPRLGTFDVFEIASEGRSWTQKAIRRIAYVDVNAVDDQMKFAENVARNRGLPMAVFSSVATAETWLSQE